MKTLLTKNPPEILLPLAQKWLENGKSFYLGPENLFRYNGIPILYENRVDISRFVGSWYICTDDMLTPRNWDLDEDEINDVSDILAQDKPIEIACFSSGYKCNARCIMCGYHSRFSPDLHKYKNEPKDIDTELLLKRIHKLKQLGITHLFASPHGEFILHPDWKEIMTFADKLGFTQSFISNGCMFTEDTADFLATLKNPLSYASFSLHSNRFDTWKAIIDVNNRKFFENAMKAPMLVKKKNICNVCVIMVLQDKNKDELMEFINYWKKKVNKISIFECADFNAPEKKIENNFPVGLCSQAHTGFLMIPTSGLIGNCCIIAGNLTAEDREGYGLPHIDYDSVETIRQKLTNPYRNKEFMKFCKKCKEFKLNGYQEKVYFEDGTLGIRVSSAIDIYNIPSLNESMKVN